MGRLGWDRIMRHNHQLATWVQTMLCERWGVRSATPLDGRMIGSMATVPLPRQDVLRKKFGAFRDVGSALFDRNRIEVPIVEWGTPPANPQWWVRPCCQIYNRPEQYERLADSVLELAN
jgi:hypothetical protein